jgi:hypothetical protein
VADEPDVSDVSNDSDDTDDTDDQQPVERLQDHLAEVSEKPDAMQERLDHLEEGIEAARRQAEADDLLPEGGDPAADGPPIAPGAFPRGDEAAEIPVDDSEFESGG